MSNFLNWISPDKRSLRTPCGIFVCQGIELGQQEKDNYKELQQRLSQLQTRFEENLLDATHDWTRLITDRSLLRGLPDTVIELAAETARQQEQTGWLFTLEFPSYYPVMAYSDDREFRQEMYTAYNTRASEQGPNAGKWDNGPLITEILSLRQELAALLGYRNYGEYSLVKKMADSPDEVMEFLNNLAAHSKAVAQDEMATLEDFGQAGVRPGRVARLGHTLLFGEIETEKIRLFPGGITPLVSGGPGYRRIVLGG